MNKTQKIFYFAVSVSDEKNNRYAYAIKVSEGKNILSVLSNHKNIEYAEICHTKKHAAELVTKWNRDYKNNGTYMFNELLF